MQVATIFENRTGQPFDRYAGLAVGLLVLFAVLIVRYALVQNVWIDEATQLSGITLSLSKMLSWLSGHEPGIFVVPDDRMPPVSYLLDWGWVRIFGDGETGLRLLHAAILYAGVVFLAATLLRLYGTRAAFAFALLVALSPKIIGFAPEIRAYPIFFGLACVATAFFLRVSVNSWQGNVRPLFLLAIVATLSTYTHFYGLVMSAALFGALSVRYILDRSKLIKVIAAGLFTLIASLGALPFVFAAQTMTRTRANTSGVGDYIEYLLTLIAGPANMVYPAAAGLFFLGIGALAAAGLYYGLRPLTKKIELNDASFSILVLAGAIILGIGATITANVFSQSLYAIKGSYSVWLFPIIMAFIAISFAQSLKVPLWDRYGKWAALGVITIAAGGATLFFTTHQQYFVHGVTDEITNAANNTEGPVAIVYEGKSDFAQGAIPAGWRLGNSVQQWISQAGPNPENKNLDKFIMGVNAVPKTIDFSTLSNMKTVLVVDINLKSYRDLRNPPSLSKVTVPQKPMAKALMNDPTWRLVNADYKHGLYSATIWRFERATAIN